MNDYEIWMNVDDLGNGFGTISQDSNIYDVNKEVSISPPVSTSLTQQADKVVTSSVQSVVNPSSNTSTSGIVGTITNWLFGKDANGNSNGVASVLGTVKTDNKVAVGLDSSSLWWIFLLIAGLFGFGWFLSSAKSKNKK
jgi:hypothetical protein